MSLPIKCVCPSCFNEIYLGECRILSSRTTGKVLKDPAKALWSRFNIESLDRPEYVLELAQRECPNCQYLLPSNIEEVVSVTLVVVGDISSGKSHYIAAFLQQLEEEWTNNVDGYVRFICLTPQKRDEYLKNYLDPLFIDQQPLAPTQSALKTTSEPLIYELAVGSSPKLPATRVNLMIYDTSGEDYERMDRLVQYARFVLNTNAFIFVADPSMMAPIFHQLPSSLQTELQPQFNLMRGRRAADRLNAIISVYERYHGYPQGSSLPDTPIAVMVSKADLLKQLGLPYTYNYMLNPQYGSSVNMRDLDAVDLEVQDLLKTYKQGSLLSATKRFKRVKFFATSATGEPPDPTTGRFTKVEPCRCLDPVLWILYQLGVIKASV